MESGDGVRQEMSWVLNAFQGVHYFQCRELNDFGLIQAFSTKEAGNMALHTNDRTDEVKLRHDRFLYSLGLIPNRLLLAHQVHGNRVQVVDGLTAGLGAESATALIPETDGLVTNDPRVVLGICTADCVPVFIYDPIAKAIGVVHAGWRGSIRRIVEVALEKMVVHFNAKPDRCKAAIGPAVCRQCFRVGQPVAEEFGAVFPEVVVEKPSGIFHVDLIRFNTLILCQAGLPEASIYMANLCTVCRREWFYSYRATQTSGRMMGVLALR